ncbi:sensor domain-containing diguanylate cyclase [Pseudoalteromonas sp. SCSIO 43095]|uniref:diguanylate cyclase domain-containing protein n=1 Tax=Pseudoalteromonas sp. SCSIO 43095 TaxID=2894202 RepID=UPI00202AD5CB|nr:diguanylate cyclase [Pseudoalteromonas sp. SCSIO 43095]URR00466.1 sensor domain-containing diguanylate cyclase [Pseudoalteromonas sp. SCSIO 43095]
MPIKRLLILFLSLAFSEAVIMLFLASFVTQFTGVWLSVILDSSLIALVAIVTTLYLFRDNDFVTHQKLRTEFLIIKIAMIVFTVEAIIMFAFNFDALMLKQWQIILIDGLILSSLSVSLIYLFVIKYAFSLNQSHNTQKNTTKLTSSLAYFCSAALLYIALYMFYQSQLQTRINNVIQHEKNELKQAKKAFLQQLNHASRDLLILRNNHHFKDHDILSSVNRAQLEQDYANFISIKNFYTQIRILDLTGKELLRVHRDKHNVAIVSAEQLQEKSHRYYFKQAIKMNPSAIFISPLDLNFENGEIEHPFKPMIRLASVLMGPKGTKIGLLIVNLEGAHLLGQLDNISKNSSGNIMLLNKDSYWLFGDTNKQWSFMFANKPQHRFKDQQPHIWQSMQTQANGIIKNENNVYIYEHLTLLNDMLLPNAIANSLINRPEWTLINKVPLAKIESEFSSLKKLIIALYLGIMTLMIFVIYTFAINTIKRRKYQAKVENYAYLDSLTGLYNRRIFLEQLDLEIIKATQLSCPLVLMYLDLDYFKPINDELGHGAGDEVLKEVAIRIKSCLRQQDIIARIGGDEFAAILPQLNDKKAIADIAERIIKSINTPFTIFDQQCSLGISIGIATSTSETQTSIKLKTQADQALYEAKKSGRNCYRFSK